MPNGDDKKHLTTPLALVGQNPYSRTAWKARPGGISQVYTLQQLQGLPTQEEVEAYKRPELSSEAAQILDLITFMAEAKRPGGTIRVPEAILPGGVTEGLRAAKVAGGATSLGASLFENAGLAIRSLFRKLGIEGPVEEHEFRGLTGLPPSQQRIVDATDPKKEISPELWAEIKKEHPQAERVYRLRRLVAGTNIGSGFAALDEGFTAAFSRGTKSSFQKQGAISIPGAIRRGQLSPPRDTQDAVMDLVSGDFLGPLMSSVLLFPVAAAGLGRVGATTAGRGILGAVAGTPARARTAASVAGAVGGGAIGEAFGEEEGVAVGAGIGAGVGFGLSSALLRGLGGTGTAFAKALVERSPQLWATLGAESALGAGYGGIYAGRTFQEVGADPQEIRREAIRGVIAGGTIGGLLAMPFRWSTLSQVGRNARAMDRILSQNRMNLVKGDIVNPETGLTFLGTRQNGSPVWGKRNPNGTYRFISKDEFPTTEQVHDFLLDKIIEGQHGLGRFGKEFDTYLERYALFDESSGLETIKARQATQLGDTPMDTPGKMARTAELGHLTTMAEVDYMPVAARQLISAGREGHPQSLDQKAALYQFVASALDPQAEPHLTATALGRARAIQRMRAYGVENIAKPAGDVPAPIEGVQRFEIESFVRKSLMDMDPEARMRSLATIRAAGQRRSSKLSSDDARQIIRAYERQSQSPELERVQEQLAPLVAAQGTRQTRGVSQGSHIILENGDLATIKSVRPRWGRVQAQVAEGESFWTTLDNVSLVPKANRLVRLTAEQGERIGRVIRPASDKRSALVRFADNTEEWIPYDHIEYMGDSQGFSRQLSKDWSVQRTRAAEGANVAAADKMVPTAPGTRAVVASTGEPVVIEAQGTTHSLVRNNKGKVRAVKNENIETSGSRAAAKTAGQPLEEPEIYVFEPGTKPEKGRNISFLELTDEEAADVIPIYLGMADIHALLGPRGGALKVFPRPPKSNTVLLAIDRAGGKAAALPSPRAKTALGILSGKKKPDLLTKKVYNSQVQMRDKGLENARVYIVPDALREHILPWSEVKQLPADRRLAYLKKLQDLSFEVNEEAFAAKTAGKTAAAARTAAKEAGRGDGVVKAEREMEQARANIVKAHLREDERVLAGLADAEAARLRSRADIPEQRQAQAVRDGDPDAMRSLIRDFPATEEGVFDYNPLVFYNEDVPGARAVVKKFINYTREGEPYTAYRVEFIAEDGSIHSAETLTPFNQRRQILVPGRAAAGTEPQVGERFLTNRGKVVEVFEEDAFTPRDTYRALNAEGQEKRQALKTALDEGQITREQFKKGEGLLLEEHRKGTRKVRMRDVETGRPLGASRDATAKVDQPFVYLEQGNVLPEQLWNFEGQAIRLYRPASKNLGLDRTNLARSPDELNAIEKAAVDLTGAEGITGIEMTYPQLLDEEQLLNQLTRKLDKYYTNVNIELNGNEYRSGYPHLYGTIYQAQGRGTARRPWTVNLWRAPDGRRDPRATRVAFNEFVDDIRATKAATLEAAKSEADGELIVGMRFGSREAAEDFLNEQGFFRPQQEVAISRSTQEALGAKLAAEADLATALPEGVSLREALGDFDLKTLKHTGGRKLPATEDFTAAQIRRKKQEVTLKRKALADVARRVGAGEEALPTLMFAERAEALAALPRRRPGGFPVELDDLPLANTVRKNQLDQIERGLMKAWDWFETKNNGYVPPELKNYMFRFGQRWQELLPEGRPPFSAQIRRAAGALADDDIWAINQVARGRNVATAADFGEETGGALEGFSIGRISSEAEGPVVLGGGGLPHDVINEYGPAASTFLPGRLMGGIDKRPITSDYIETAQAIKRFHDAVVDRAPAWRSVDRTPDPTSPLDGLGEATIVEVPTEDGGRVLGRVVGYDFNDATVQVLTPDKKTFMMPMEEVEVMRSASAKTNYVNQAKTYMGEPTYVETAPDIGFSAIDKAIDVPIGSTPEVFFRRLDVRMTELLEGKVSPGFSHGPRLKFTPKGHKFHKDVGEPEMKELVNLYIRATELGNGSAVLNRLPNTPLRNQFKRAVYEHIMDEIGDRGAMAHGVALVKSGLANKKMLTALRTHAVENGINDPNPVVQIEELMKHNVLNPEIAETMVTINKSAGYLRLFEQEGVDPRLIDFAPIARSGDIKHIWHTHLASTRYVADRHPAVELFVNNIFDAQNQEGLLFEQVVLGPEQRILDHYGLSGTRKQVANAFKRLAKGEAVKGVKQVKQARDLLDQYATWDDVLEAIPDVDPGVEFAFREMRAFTEEMRLYTIGSAVRQGRKWTTWGELKRTPNFTKHLRTFREIPDDDVAIVDPRSFGGMRRTKSDSDRFISLLDQYDKSADVPADIRKEYPEWMIEEFDLWKNFGIDNYWPYVHRGHIAVQQLDSEGVWRTAAWARSGMEAISAVGELQRMGKVAANTQIRFDPKGYTLDDLMLNNMSRDQYDRLVRGFMKATKLERASVSDILTGQGLRPIGGRTQLQSLQLREANLRGIIDNPLQELRIYGARVARNRYLLDIDDAYSWMLGNQKQISRAFNVPEFDELPQLTSFVNDLWATSKGEAGGFERFLDTMIGLVDWAAHWPVQTAKAIGAAKTTDMELREIMSTYLSRDLFNRPFMARELAGKIAGMQGAWKLGITPMAALVNTSQLAINTWPYLGTRYFNEGVKKTLGLRLGSLPEEEAALLTRVITESGIKFQASVAGMRPGIMTPGQMARFQQIKNVTRPMISRGSLGGLSPMETLNHTAMYGFEKAERYNRFVTAIGAYLKATAPKNKGGLAFDHDGAVAFARRAVEDTQFLYFDAALPKLLRGPGAKVVAQFKTYMYNQLKFEKDLFKRMAHGDGEAWNVMGKHATAIFALGGARGLAKHPFLGGAMGIAGFTNRERLFDLFGEPKAMTNRYQDRQLMDKDERYATFTVKDALTHGLPGLVGLTVADRVGISSTDMMFWNNQWGFFAGPHGSVYGHMGPYLWRSAEVEGGGLRTAGALGLPAIMASVARTGAFGMTRLPPLAPAALAVVGAHQIARLASDPTAEAWGVLDREIPESARMRNELLPKFVKDALRTWEIFQNANYVDSNNRPIPMPATGPAHSSAMLWSVIGGRSIHAAESAAFEQMMTAKDQIHKSTRSVMIDILAGKAMDAEEEGYGDYYKTLSEARKRNYFITSESLRPALLSRSRARTRTLMDRVSAETKLAEMLED